MLASAAQATSNSELDNVPLALSDEDVSQVLEIGTAISRATYGRRFGRTRKGYLGLVPPKAVLGVRTPFMLRKVVASEEEGEEVSYTIVGECYVHGLMNGEG